MKINLSIFTGESTGIGEHQGAETDHMHFQNLDKVLSTPTNLARKLAASEVQEQVKMKLAQSVSVTKDH